MAITLHLIGPLEVFDPGGTPGTKRIEHAKHTLHNNSNCDTGVLSTSGRYSPPEQLRPRLDTGDHGDTTRFPKPQNTARKAHISPRDLEVDGAGETTAMTVTTPASDGSRSALTTRANDGTAKTTQLRPRLDTGDHGDTNGYPNPHFQARTAHSRWDPEVDRCGGAVAALLSVPLAGPRTPAVSKDGNTTAHSQLRPRLDIGDPGDTNGFPNPQNTARKAHFSPRDLEVDDAVETPSGPRDRTSVGVVKAGVSGTWLARGLSPRAARTRSG